MAPRGKLLLPLDYITTPGVVYYLALAHFVTELSDLAANHMDALQGQCHAGYLSHEASITPRLPSLSVLGENSSANGMNTLSKMNSYAVSLVLGTTGMFTN